MLIRDLNIIKGKVSAFAVFFSVPWVHPVVPHVRTPLPTWDLNLVFSPLRKPPFLEHLGTSLAYAVAEHCALSCYHLSLAGTGIGSLGR